MWGVLSLYCAQVAKGLMRPFGTGDDDIELNYILDRSTTKTVPSSVKTVQFHSPKPSVTNHIVL